jgi:hypothetical protein
LRGAVFPVRRAAQQEPIRQQQADRHRQHQDDDAPEYPARRVTGASD